MFILSVEINISRAVTDIDVNVATSSMTVNTKVKSVSFGSGRMLPFYNIITSVESVCITIVDNPEDSDPK